MHGVDVFHYDRRLDLLLPDLPKPWHEYTERERADILVRWETIRGTIPERIRQLEGQIATKLAALNEETDFAACCRLNDEMADLASRINELNIWFRTDQDAAAKPHG